MAPSSRKLAVSFTGGKDSMTVINILRSPNTALCAVKEIAWRLDLEERLAKVVDCDVALLVTFVPKGGKQSFKAHPLEIVKLQARALGLPHLIMEVDSDRSFLDSYKANISCLREQYGITALATGDILDVCSSFMPRAAAGTGVELLTPLWGIERRLLLELVWAYNMKPLITCVNTTKFMVSTTAVRPPPLLPPLTSTTTDAAATTTDAAGTMVAVEVEARGGTQRGLVSRDEEQLSLGAAPGDSEGEGKAGEGGTLHKTNDKEQQPQQQQMRSVTSPGGAVGAAADVQAVAAAAAAAAACGGLEAPAPELKVETSAAASGESNSDTSLAGRADILLAATGTAAALTTRHGPPGALSGSGASRLDGLALLGQRLDRKLYENVLLPARELYDVDECGEWGEYHTMITDSLLFTAPIRLSFEHRQEGDYAFLALRAPDVEE